MDNEPSPDVIRLLAPFLERPSKAAVLSDFDGTLAPIVVDPAEARPVDGALDVLARLARRFGVVAVISGRPASFLLDRVTSGTVRGKPPAGLSSVHFVGLYGLEWANSDGVVTVKAGLEPWRPVVEGAVERLRSSAPPGVEVEGKGLAVTVHWRRAPEASDWAVTAAQAEAAHCGLMSHPGRMSIELRPPSDTDKGSVVRALASGGSAACYLGDDLGDLPAFAALSDLAASEGLLTASIAAVDEESAPEVAEAADAVVEGPAGALAVLDWLAGAADEARVPPG